MKPLPTTYDVHATISPDGRAEKSNVLTRKTFRTINSYFSHEDIRWLIVSKTDERDILAIDLWLTATDHEFPYVVPTIIRAKFKTVDQAIGFVNINLVT